MKSFTERSAMVLLFSLVLGCGSGTGSAHPQTTDELCKYALDAIKTQNYDKYVKLLRNPEDFGWLQQAIIADLEKTGEKDTAAMFNTNLEKEAIEYQERYEQDSMNLRKMVLEVYTKGVSDGIDWPNASFLSADAAQEKEDMGIKGALLTCTVMSQNKMFNIHLDSVLKVKRGWIVSEPPRWVGQVVNK